MSGSAPPLENPYPGLRPFNPQEDYLFFGRDQVIDQLLARLRQSRFLAVIGSSGCGKSSVVRAGMVPSLYSGYMLPAGSSWRVAICRPGSDPIANLVAALCQPQIFPDQDNLLGKQRLLMEATLRRSNLGLVECFRQARLPAQDNLLIVVDQFEELFRFKRDAPEEAARAEGVALVKRLLAAAAQSELPIYIALTMRSDFIGECTSIPGLPDAINAGQFLVPRMDRQELRSAITGPAAVGGVTITGRLVVRLLNEVGDDPDQLPVLQHALMRTWDNWQARGHPDTALDLEHYDAIGTLRHALSKHAEEAFADVDSLGLAEVTAQVFQALIDVNADNRITRNPTSISKLAAIARTDLKQVCQVVDCFRQPGRCFLMPPAEIELAADTVVDLSHESLARIWSRLHRWAGQERESVQALRRLIDATEHYELGLAGLWRDPELAFGLQWCQQQQPTEAWAAQYASGLDRALEFLESSRLARQREAVELRQRRTNRLLLAWGSAFVLLVFTVYALHQQRQAEHARSLAENNLRIAKQSVDEMLTVVGRDLLADLPQMEAVRNDLLLKARAFYHGFEQQHPDDVELAMESAMALVRVADIDQLRGQDEQATVGYQAGITELNRLDGEGLMRPLQQLELVRAYDSLGIHLTDIDSTAAEVALAESIRRAEVLARAHPGQAEFRHEQARSYNNMGILLARNRLRWPDAEASYRQAIALFRGIEDYHDESRNSFMLAKTLNSLGNLQQSQDQPARAAASYGAAIAGFEALVAAAPHKREYRENLARSYNNLANAHLRNDQLDAALGANDKSLGLFNELAHPIPALRIELANSYNSRGGILEQLVPRTEVPQVEAYGDAIAAFAKAVNLLDSVAGDSGGADASPSVNQRQGNALANIARLRLRVDDYPAAWALLAQAEVHHLRAVNSAATSAQYVNSLSDTYWLQEETAMRAGNYRDAAAVARRHARQMPQLKAQYRAARVLTYAASAAGVQSDHAEAERYAAQAVELLQRARKSGMPIEQLQTQSQPGKPFAGLRDRADFKALLKQ